MKKQNSLVSILVINFNNAKLITRAINSCLSQSYKKIEILVFDDKSTDKSKKVLMKLKKEKKIKVFFNKNKKKGVPAFDAMNGYNKLFDKSKGEIICLLDSDDYFDKLKVQKIVDEFKKKKSIEFIQNLPNVKNGKKLKKKKNKNNPISFWPYLAPESCISFRRNLMIKFKKINKEFKNKFPDIWFGFRLGVYAYFYKKKFYTLNENLTFYESLGESKKYSFFGKNWIFRRKESFEYLKKILKRSKDLNKNLDYLMTNMMLNLYK